ncbi:carbohydrate ABC transporter permease [Paenibacillus sp. CGMCC 1.16610]|uniref:Carbohydrate ABC transporter permease n=3 Tax=Paenibacillus TaxID=44249 RepID=A0ABU3RAE6_9BACL|nr:MULTISPECIES: carbohydrate ABC transporter permease [Paenibacillus]MBA2937697.1 carbohydrate ABC transporter permease [Paenibacillus sp. CGMCC 1.16610]MCY9659169.1 carbohydrate ABC transporter permease [Paenibacillus anseongense]MDU0201217.1 carbohydrate ABC transporter permease [Paenibacillus sp. PFR10]MEB4796496.1 carbohydrate ABC transporter permease [Paenibacillus chondroitinus]MEC0265074.1 carbohydrate ABC transporter permease [Paenibacillus anseongense]
MKESHILESRGDKWFNWVNMLLICLFLVVILYPLVFVVSASISSPDAVISGKVWLWPVQPTLDGYAAVFKHKLIWSSFRNSVFYTVAGTLLSVVLTIAAAYPLSRRDLFGKNWFMLLFVFTTMFSGGLIPSYLLVKDLGMLNTAWAMIIPSAMSVFNIIITRTYFKTTLPDEMLEAAQIDGCNDFRYVFSIVLQLSGPIIAVVALYSAVGYWNQYFNGLLYLDNQKLYPLQLVLREILVQNEVDASMLDMKEIAAQEGLRALLKYSLIVVSSLPLLLVYPFVQKYFIKGVMIGSLKG